MRSTWPVYHPTTGKCVKRNSTETPFCYYRDRKWHCVAQKQQLGLDTCSTNTSRKWKYRGGGTSKNIQDTSGNYWQVFGSTFGGGPVVANKFSNFPGHLAYKYLPSAGNKFYHSAGKNPGQSVLKANNSYLINNTNTGDIKLVATPGINTKESRYNFESPIFKRNNDVLLNRWYTDPKLSSWKGEVKKAFQYLLGKNQGMQKECCKRSGKYHKDLCGGWYGPSEACEGILSESEIANCCRGTGNQHACGKYWGPNKTGECDSNIKAYCATEDGLKDPKCGCLWPNSVYDENVYQIGGPALDSRCDLEAGYDYSADPWTAGTNEHIDTNCKILFDRIANGQTIHYSDQKTLDSACSRYLAEEARKKAEEEALIRKLQAEEQERRFQASSTKDQIVAIASEINNIKNKIGELKSSVYAIASGLTSVMASNATNVANDGYNAANDAVSMVKSALEMANAAVNAADTNMAAEALSKAKSALTNAQQALSGVQQAVNDAKAAKQAAFDAASADEQARLAAEEAKKKAEELLAKQQAETAALLEEQALAKKKLEAQLTQQGAPPEVIEEEIKKLEEQQLEEQNKMVAVHDEEKEVGLLPDGLLSTPVIIVLVVVVLLVLLGVGAALAIKFLR